MSREIKFRAMALDKLYGLPKFGLDEIGNWDESCDVFYVKATPDIPCLISTIMQYTGLKDKNGKEIYEGDIVKNEDGGWTGDLYRIEWSLAGFSWFKFYDAHRKKYIADIIDQKHAPIYYGNSYEIIGDIHTTPKLMGKEND